MRDIPNRQHLHKDARLASWLVACGKLQRTLDDLPPDEATANRHKKDVVISWEIYCRSKEDRRLGLCIWCLKIAPSGFDNFLWNLHLCGIW